MIYCMFAAESRVPCSCTVGRMKQELIPALPTIIMNMAAPLPKDPRVIICYPGKF